MITSAWGPAAMAAATAALTAPPMATTPPKADWGSPSRARSVGLDQVAGHRRPAGVGVLDDGHGACSPASVASSWTSRQAASVSKMLR